MNWSAYEVFSVVSGIMLVGAGIFIQGGDFRARDRLTAIVGGAFLAGYGFYVANQTSGTWRFPAVIFVLPFVFAFLLIMRAVSGRQPDDSSATHEGSGLSADGTIVDDQVMSPSKATSIGEGSTRPRQTAHLSAGVDDAPGPDISVAARRTTQGRRVFAIVAGIAVLIAVVGAAALWWPRFAGSNGGQTTVVLSAHTPSGQLPDEARLNSARDLLKRRLETAGFDDPEVATTPTGLVVSVRGVHAADEFRGLIEPAEIRFRKVLATIVDQPGGSPQPAANAVSGLPTLGDVQAKLGNAYTIAATADGVALAHAGGAPAVPALDRFAELTPSEVAVLPYNVQFAVPQISCATLNLRPAGSIGDPAERAVACDTAGDIKYMLDVAKVVGTDLADAQASVDAQTGTQWTVDITFTAAGSDKWASLTREAFTHLDRPCDETALGANGGCQVAVVLDNRIITAPEIQGVLSTRSTIYGAFDEASARLLASQLKHGALPVALEIVSIASANEG